MKRNNVCVQVCFLKVNDGGKDKKLQGSSESVRI